MPRYKVPALPTAGWPWPGRTEVVLRERSEVFKFCWLRNSWSKVTFFQRPYMKQMRAWAPRPQLVLPKPRQPREGRGLLKPLRVQCEGHRPGQGTPGDSAANSAAGLTRSHTATLAFKPETPGPWWPPAWARPLALSAASTSCPPPALLSNAPAPSLTPQAAILPPKPWI